MPSTEDNGTISAHASPQIGITKEISPASTTSLVKSTQPPILESLLALSSEANLNGGGNSKRSIGLLDGGYYKSPDPKNTTSNPTTEREEDSKYAPYAMLNNSSPFRPPASSNNTSPIFPSTKLTPEPRKLILNGLLRSSDSKPLSFRKTFTSKSTSPMSSKPNSNANSAKSKVKTFHFGSATPGEQSQKNIMFVEEDPKSKEKKIRRDLEKRAFASKVPWATPWTENKLFTISPTKLSPDEPVLSVTRTFDKEEKKPTRKQGNRSSVSRLSDGDGKEETPKKKAPKISRQWRKGSKGNLGSHAEPKSGLSKDPSKSPIDTTQAEDSEGALITARERRRREIFTARDASFEASQRDKNKENENSGNNGTKKSKRVNKELQSLTEWSDWIYQTLDKKRRLEHEELKRLEAQDSPPKKRRSTRASTSKSEENQGNSPGDQNCSSGIAPPSVRFPIDDDEAFSTSTATSTHTVTATSNAASDKSTSKSFSRPRGASFLSRSEELPRSQKPFEEPIPTEPIMSVTGLPLDAPPSTKIKKESLWPKKKATRRKINRRGKSESSELESDGQEMSPEAVEDDLNAVELELNKGLKTKVNEKLQKPSEIRSSVNMPPFEATKKADSEIETDTTPQPSDPHLAKKKRRAGKEEKRKIKNASPKKNRENPFGYDNPLQLAGEKRDTAFEFGNPAKDNDDYCASCGEPGIFLCCEHCPRSFHFACCDPPYDEKSLPDGEWYCNECRTLIDPQEYVPPGLFSKLIQQIGKRNPVQFKLPKNIRERFEGVATGNNGEYEDTDQKPYKPAKIGAFQQTAPELHYDKQGNPLVCVKCGETGITPNKLMGEVDKPIISCEYCPSSWHLDCLSPPLSTIKQLGSKWKCPNHSDDLITPKRRVKKAKVVDVDLPRGFRNDGHIEIAPSSDSESEDDGAVIVRTPPHMANYDTENGVAAVPCEAQQKLWKDEYIVYRLPERGVVLDFMDKIHEQKMKIQEAKIDEYYNIARENRQLLQKLVLDSKHSASEKQALNTLVELQEADFKELVGVASKELEAGGSIGCNDTDLEITLGEMKELMEIKKLMSIKGKEKLLDFLRQ